MHRKACSCSLDGQFACAPQAFPLMQWWKVRYCNFMVAISYGVVIFLVNRGRWLWRPTYCACVYSQHPTISQINSLNPSHTESLLIPPDHRPYRHKSHCWPTSPLTRSSLLSYNSFATPRCSHSSKNTCTHSSTSIVDGDKGGHVSQFGHHH